MTHDGRLLARAREALEDERRENQAEQQRRTDLIYHRIPEIESIDRRMRSQMSDLVRLTLSKPADLSHRLEKLQKENLDLQMRKAELLHAQGFPIDYLDEIVSCKVCGDTGMVDGRLCACMERRYNRELTKELSVLLRSGDESFERFDLSLYPDTPERAQRHADRLLCLQGLCRQLSGCSGKPQESAASRRFRSGENLSLGLYCAQCCGEGLFRLL